MPSRDDVIAPKRLANGVVVPPALQVNELTIGEKRAHVATIGLTVTRAQWVQMFGEAAVVREFETTPGNLALPAPEGGLPR